MAKNWNLAEFNVATGLGPVDDKIMSGFVSRLEEINGIADKSPGFVWRLQASDGNATSIRAYSNERILINLSAWETIEDFRDFVYNSPHGGMVQSGRSWFEEAEQPQIVMWWIEVGQKPTVEDGVRRLSLLREKGPTLEGFSFAVPFSAPT